MDYKKVLATKFAKVNQKNGILRRVTYECVKPGKHVPQISSEPTKFRNASSQKTNCPCMLTLLTYHIQNQAVL